jgi:hypothetical protein
VRVVFAAVAPNRRIIASFKMPEQRSTDFRLAALVGDILNSNGQENPEFHLPGPYYSLSDVVKWKYKELLQNYRSDIDQDNHYRRSWFVEALLMLLVRRNYKSTCKTFWPAVTRFTHVRTILPDPIYFGPAPCESAICEEKLIDTRTQTTWSKLTEEASQTTTPRIPGEFLSHPVLVLLYCMFCPYRMDRDMILWLDPPILSFLMVLARVPWCSPRAALQSAKLGIRHVGVSNVDAESEVGNEAAPQVPHEIVP